jgi:predicted flavoprotein YhiN
MEEGLVTLEVDLTPGETFESLSSLLKEWTSAHPRRGISVFLEGLVPSRLEEEVLASAGLENVPCQQVSKKGLNRLVERLKGWPIGSVRAVPLERGEVVAGGISLDEVDPQTMRSLVMKGLYPCGEILDIAGPVGGYNLQSAFATGFVAGETAAMDALHPQSSR